MIAGAEIVTGIMIEIVVMIENVIGIRIVLAVMIQEVGVGHAPVLGSVQGTMIATGGMIDIRSLWMDCQMDFGILVLV